MAITNKNPAHVSRVGRTGPVVLLGADSRLSANDDELTEAEVDAFVVDLNRQKIEDADARAVRLQHRDDRAFRPWEQQS